MRAKQVSRYVGRWALLTSLLASSFAVAMPSQCSVTSTGRIPLNDLGAGLYAGEMGGLYPNGSNQRPSSHDLALDRVGRILLRDAQGNPDPQFGKIVLMSVGLSNTTMEFRTFQTLAGDDQEMNAAVVLVEGFRARGVPHQQALRRHGEAVSPDVADRLLRLYLRVLHGVVQW